MPRMVWSVVRVAFGAFFILIGGMIGKSLLFGGHPPQQETAAALAFVNALRATRFIDPLLALDFVIGGTAVIVPRTTALGLVLLFPPVLVIFCFHWLLDDMHVWGSLWMIWWVVLAWPERHKFAALWADQPRPR